MFDISVPFAPSTPPWPGDTPCSCGWAWSRAAGASVNVGRIETSPHVGTHADAPLHVADNAPGADALPLEPFIGAATVVDLRGRTGVLDLDALRAAGCPEGVERLILRTDRTVATGAFPDTWPTLTSA
ncbi:MAG: cyclase family protein, partial [Gemmatimonadota bacterium]|nr:cyclase family protein [Gemmatimonadota bacterium]